jgi:FtsZ-binding cell division protein ZapB
MNKVTLIIIATFALGVSVVFPDKLSDFKDAKRAADQGKGCESIPYSDLRGNCIDQQGYVHDWCDGKEGPNTCGSEEATRQVVRGVERAKKNVEELKEKKSRLESDKSRASTDDEKNKISKEIEQVDRDIYEGGKGIDQAQRDLEARKKLVDDAIYTLNKCLDYRHAVMNVFAYAIDKVRTEDDTPEIKDLARQLLGTYQDSKGGHEQAITGHTNALNTCKNSKP